MKNEIENKLKTAIENSVPDVLENILSECDNPKETVIVMTKTKKRFTAFAAVAAALFIFAATGAIAIGYNNSKPDSTIMIDVNPSIELKISKNDRVLSATALNQDAEKILDGMDFKNVQLDMAVNAIVGSMLKNGYISDIQNSILVSVENSSKEKSEQLQKKISDNIGQMLESASISPAILTLSVNEDDEISKLANEYGISLGKAALIKGIIEQDTKLNETDLSQLNINDINSLIEGRNTKVNGIVSNGKASNEAYIGESAAQKIAFTHAGIENAERVECEIDVENGVIVYDIEFYKDGVKYEYEIGCVDGKVVKATTERDDDLYDDDDDNTVINAKITQAQAAEIAYKHAGVTGVSGKVEYDSDDGKYDIEFYKDGVKYDYEISGADGKVIKAETERDDDWYDDSGVTNAKITRAQAAEIAYKHAGVTGVSGKVEYDSDDGKYDIEFYKDGVKYDYEISGADGKIIKAETERDDDDDDDNTVINAKITQAQAAEIAYKHAGVTGVSGKVEYDSDDGKYDIEFYKDGVKYDYEISGADGKIIKAETERDDDDLYDDDDDRYDD